MTVKSSFEKLIGIRRISDPIFGEIRYQKVGFWEGQILFPPLNSMVEVLIDGDESGPTDEQRKFISVLEKRYENVTLQANEKLNEDALTDGWSDRVVSSDLKLETIDIPLSPNKNGEWTLTYLHLPSGSHCQVNFQEWKVSSVMIESC